MNPWKRRALVATILAAAIPALGAAPEPTTPPQTPPNGRLLSLSAASLPEGASARPEYAAILNDVAVSSITYASDGLKVKGYLAVPKAGEHLPCVIWNRDGNRAFRAVTNLEAVTVLGALARRGYIVVASQYRGSPGSDGRDELGGGDVDDVLNLLPLLESLPRADPGRVGIVGLSRGGMMTYLALSRTTRIAAAVVASGISDLFEWLEKRRDMESAFEALVPDFHEKREETLAARSAIRWPEKLAPQTPILILAGARDWSVSPQQSLDMARALLARHHPFRLVLLERAGHDLREQKDEADREITGWLDRYVRDREPFPGAGTP